MSVCRSNWRFFKSSFRKQQYLIQILNQNLTSLPLIKRIIFFGLSFLLQIYKDFTTVFWQAACFFFILSCFLTIFMSAMFLIERIWIVLVCCRFYNPKILGCIGSVFFNDLFTPFCPFSLSMRIQISEVILVTLGVARGARIEMSLRFFESAF